MFFLNIRMRLWQRETRITIGRFRCWLFLAFVRTVAPRLALQLASVKKMPGINTAMAHALSDMHVPASASSMQIIL